eukprot:g15160.t1
MDPSLQQCGCGLLRNLTVSNDDYKVRAVRLGSAERVCEALARHDDVRVQRQACAVLFNLASVGLEETRKGWSSLLAAGGLKQVCQAMRQFRTVRSLQMAAFEALLALPSEAAKEEARQPLMRYIQEFPDEVPLLVASSNALAEISMHEGCVHGCVAPNDLGSLPSDREAAGMNGFRAMATVGASSLEAALEARCIERARMALLDHKDHEEVQSRGLDLLQRVAAYNTNMRDLIIEAGLYPIVFDAQAAAAPRSAPRRSARIALVAGDRRAGPWKPAGSVRDRPDHPELNGLTVASVTFSEQDLSGFDGADLARVRETMGSVTSGDAVGEEEDAAEMGMAADLLRGVGEVLKSLRESARINELSLLSLTQKLRQKTSRTRGSIEQKNSSKPLARSGSDVLGKEHNQAKYHLKQVTSGLEGLTDIANSVEDAKDNASTKAQTVDRAFQWSTAALARFMDCPAVQSALLLVVNRLCLKNPDVKVAYVKAKILPLIWQILETENLFLRGRSLAVLATLASNCFSVTEEMMQMGALELAVDMLQSHTENAQIQGRSIQMLWGFMQVSRDPQVEEIYTEEMLDVVLTSIQSHATKEQLQSFALGFLWTFTSSSLRKRWLLARKGVATVCTSLEAFPHSSMVQRHGLEVLRSMSTSDGRTGGQKGWVGRRSINHLSALLPALLSASPGPGQHSLRVQRISARKSSTPLMFRLRGCHPGCADGRIESRRF